MTHSVITAALVTALSLFTGTAYAEHPSTQAQHVLDKIQSMRAKGEIPKGTTLRLGFKQGNINAYLGRELELQREWEEKTGILIVTQLIPQLPAQEILSSTPGLDLTVARNHEFPELLGLGLIEDLTPLMNEFGFRLDDNMSFGYIRPDLQAYVGKRVAAIPADGDLVVLYLRRDLLDDPAEQAAFRQATGRELAPPQTWDEYEELIRFFYRPDKPLYGTAEERDPEGAWMKWLPRYLSMAAPYQPLFDENMRPLIDSPAGIQATRSYVSTVPYSPPAMTKQGNNYSYTLPFYMRGEVFAALTTMSSSRLFHADQSPVRGKFQVYPVPGNLVNGKLLRRNTIIYGNNLIIPKGAANAKLALLYALWITAADTSTRSVGVPGGFTDPYRWNHLKDAGISRIYTQQALDVFAKSWDYTLPPGTGLPGDGEYLAELDRALTAAASGEITVEQAMRQTANRWEAITERYGRESQIRYWREFRRNFKTNR